MQFSISPIYVGVDVSKEHLDIHLSPLEKNLRVTNTKQGVRKLIGILNKHNLGQIVCEASGGYERLMLKQLKRSNYKVWVVQPRRIRAFIISEGINAKSDKIDAKMIALFASQKQSSYQPVDLHKMRKCCVHLPNIELTLLMTLLERTTSCSILRKFAAKNL